MEVYTDLPGVQIYAGNYLVNEPGKDGIFYKKRTAADSVYTLMTEG